MPLDDERPEADQEPMLDVSLTSPRVPQGRKKSPRSTRSRRTMGKRRLVKPGRSSSPSGDRGEFTSPYAPPPPKQAPWSAVSARAPGSPSQKSGLMSKSQGKAEPMLPHIHTGASMDGEWDSMSRATDAATKGTRRPQRGGTAGENVDVDAILHRLDESFRVQQMEQQAIMRRAFRFARNANPEQLDTLHEKLDKQLEAITKQNKQVKEKMKDRLISGRLAEEELRLRDAVPRSEMMQQVDEDQLREESFQRPSSSEMRMEPDDGEIVALASTRFNIGSVMEGPPKMDVQAQKKAVMNVVSAAKDISTGAIESALTTIRIETALKRMIWLANDYNAHQTYTLSANGSALSRYIESRRQEAEQAVIKLRQDKHDAVNTAIKCEEGLKRAKLEVLEAEGETKSVANRAFEAEEELRRMTRRALEAETDLKTLRMRTEKLDADFVTYKNNTDDEKQRSRMETEAAIRSLRGDHELEMSKARREAEEALLAKSEWAQTEITLLRKRVSETEKELDESKRLRRELEDKLERDTSLLQLKLKNTVSELESEKHRLLSEHASAASQRISEITQDMQEASRTKSQELIAAEERFKSRVLSISELHTADMAKVELQAKQNMEHLRTQLEADIETLKQQHKLEKDRMTSDLYSIKKRAAAEIDNEKTLGETALRQLRKRAAKAEEELDKSIYKVQELTRELAKTKQNMDEMAHSQAEEITSLRKRLSQQVEDLTREATTAKDELAIMKEKFAESDTEVKKLKRELREIIPMTNQKTAELKALVAQQQSVLGILRDHQIGSDQASEERRAEVQGLQQLLADQKVLIEQLQSREGEAQLSQIKAESEKRVHELEVELKETKDELRQLKKTHATMNSAQGLMASELKSQQTKAALRLEELEATKKTLTEVRAELKELTVVSESQHLELHRLREAQNEHMEAEGFSTVELTELRADNDRLAKEVKHLTAKVAHLQSHHEAALEGTVTELETAHASQLEQVERGHSEKLASMEAKLNQHIAQKEQLRQRCERMRHDHSVEIDDLMQEQSFQLSLHEEREAEYQRHEQEMQTKLMQLAETYTKLKQTTLAQKPDLEDVAIQATVEMLEMNTQTSTPNQVTAQASQTPNFNSHQVTMGIQLDLPATKEGPWDLRSYDSQDEEEDAISPTRNLRRSQAVGTTSPLVVRDMDDFDVGTQTAQLDQTLQLRVDDVQAQEHESVSTPASVKTQTLDELPGDDVAPVVFDTFMQQPPTIGNDCEEVETQFIDSTVGETPSAMEFSQEVVSKFMDDIVSQSLNNSFDSANEGVSMTDSPPRINVYSSAMSITEKTQRPLEDPALRSEYAGGLVGGILGNVSLDIGEDVKEARQADETEGQRGELFFRGSLEVEERRWVVRARQNNHTGYLEMELFDPLKDDARVIAASPEEWSAAGFSDLAVMERADRLHLVRWLCHEKLHRLREKPAHSLYNGMLVIHGVNCTVTALDMTEKTDKVDRLRVEILVPATGFTSTIDVRQDEWAGFSSKALMDLDEAEVIQLVRWVCENRGYVVDQSQPRQPVSVCKGAVKIGGVRLLLQASMLPGSEHPLQILFYDPSSETKYEIQLNQSAWERIQTMSGDVSEAVRRFSEGYVTWTEYGELQVEQVTWTLESEKNRPWPQTPPKEVHVPSRPSQESVRVSVKINNQLSCLTITQSNDHVELSLHLLITDRVHHLKLGIDEWRDVGLGPDFWTSARDTRKEMAVAFAEGMRIAPSGRLFVVPTDGGGVEEEEEQTVDGDDQSVQTHRTEGSALSRVSWEGANPSLVSEKVPEHRVVKHTGAVDGIPMILAVSESLGGVQVEVLRVDNNERRLVHISEGRWLDLGLGGIFTVTGGELDELFGVLCGMMHWRPNGRVLVDEFSFIQQGDMSDDIPVTSVEWYENYMDATLEDGSNLLVRYLKHDEGGVRLIAAHIGQECKNPIFTALEFKERNDAKTQYIIPAIRLGFYGMADFWKLGDDVRRAAVMGLVGNLTYNKPGESIQHYSQPSAYLQGQGATWF